MSSWKYGTTFYRTSETNKDKHASNMGCGPVSFNTDGRFMTIVINFGLLCTLRTKPSCKALILIELHNSKELSKSATLYRPQPIPSTSHSLYEENWSILTNKLNNQPNKWPYHIVQETSRQLFTAESLVQYRSVLWKLWQIRWPICGLTNMDLSLTLLLQLQQGCK